MPFHWLYPTSKWLLPGQDTKSCLLPNIFFLFPSSYDFLAAHICISFWENVCSYYTQAVWLNRRFIILEKCCYIQMKNKVPGKFLVYYQNVKWISFVVKSRIPQCHFFVPMQFSNIIFSLFKLYKYMSSI